jgi:hypothetical protein
MSGEHRNTTEEEAGAWKTEVLPLLLNEYHAKAMFNADEWVIRPTPG